MASIIRMEEVKRHKNRNSVWMVIDNSVYDVTKFLDEHPGGAETLLENAGKDSTIAFEDVGHSDDARSLMAKYKIGELHPIDRDTSGPMACACKPAKGRRRPERKFRRYDSSPNSPSPQRSEISENGYDPVQTKVNIQYKECVFSNRYLIMAGGVIAVSAIGGFIAYRYILK